MINIFQNLTQSIQNAVTAPGKQTSKSEQPAVPFSLPEETVNSDNLGSQAHEFTGEQDVPSGHSDAEHEPRADQQQQQTTDDEIVDSEKEEPQAEATQANFISNILSMVSAQGQPVMKETVASMGQAQTKPQPESALLRQGNEVEQPLVLKEPKAASGNTLMGVEQPIKTEQVISRTTSELPIAKSTILEQPSLKNAPATKQVGQDLIVQAELKPVLTNQTEKGGMPIQQNLEVVQSVTQSKSELRDLPPQPSSPQPSSPQPAVKTRTPIAEQPSPSVQEPKTKVNLEQTTTTVTASPEMEKSVREALKTVSVSRDLESKPIVRESLNRAQSLMEPAPQPVVSDKREALVQANVQSAKPLNVEDQQPNQKIVPKEIEGSVPTVKPDKGKHSIPVESTTQRQQSESTLTPRKQEPNVQQSVEANPEKRSSEIVVQQPSRLPVQNSKVEASTAPDKTDGLNTADNTTQFTERSLAPKQSSFREAVEKPVDGNTREAAQNTRPVLNEKARIENTDTTVKGKQTTSDPLRIPIVEPIEDEPVVKVLNETQKPVATAIKKESNYSEAKHPERTPVNTVQKEVELSNSNPKPEVLRTAPVTNTRDVVQNTSENTEVKAAVTQMPQPRASHESQEQNAKDKGDTQSQDKLEIAPKSKRQPIAATSESKVEVSKPVNTELPRLVNESAVTESVKPREQSVERVTDRVVPVVAKTTHVAKDAVPLREPIKASEPLAKPMTETVAVDNKQELGVQQEQPLDLKKNDTIQNTKPILAKPTTEVQFAKSDKAEKQEEATVVRVERKEERLESVNVERRDASVQGRINDGLVQQSRTANITHEETAFQQEKQNLAHALNEKKNLLTPDIRALENAKKGVGMTDAKHIATMNTVKTDTAFSASNTFSGMNYERQESVQSGMSHSGGGYEHRQGSQSGQQGGQPRKQASDKNEYGQSYNIARLSQAGTHTPAAQVQQAFSEPSAYTSLQSEVIPAIIQQIDRLRKNGRNNVKMTLELSGGQSLTVQLRLDSDQVKVRFQTESADLREALEGDWSRLSQDAKQQGVQLAKPEFYKEELTA